MDAFSVLGLPENAPEEEIRQAYHRLAKTCHPDLYTEAEDQQRAQEKMVRLNLAYREAMSKAADKNATYVVIPREKAMAMAENYCSKKQYDRALVQLSHVSDRDAAWYGLQGKALMGMRQYSSALQAYRFAVQLDPDSQEYHEGCLQAAVQVRKHQKVTGRVADWARDLFKKNK